MNPAPRIGSPLKQLRAARATASLERASTRRVGKEFMIKIRKHELIQKDVKNEGCSQDVIETKGREYTNFHQANIVMKINGLSEMPVC
jgi:hypothetical protein